jgi:hypothetical protein
MEEFLMAFTDYKKAFYGTKREYILKSLKKKSISADLLRKVKPACEDYELH